MRLRSRRCPVVLQMEMTECGAASLAMVLGYFGKFVPLDVVGARGGTTRDGVTAARIMAAARSFGLAAKAVRTEPEDLATLPTPFIAHWNFDHFVVVEKVRRDRFHLIDPAAGRRVADRASFGRSFTGIALIFDPADGFPRGGRPPSALATLAAEAAHSPDALVLSGLLGLAATVPGIALSGAVGVFTDHVATRHQPSWAGTLIAGLVAVALCQGALAILTARVAAGWRTKIATEVAVRGFWRAMRLPLAFFQQRSAGELVARLRLGSEVGGAVAGPLASALPNVLAMGVYLAAMAAFDPLIAGAASLVALVNCAILCGLGGLVDDANRRQQVADGQAAGVAAAGFLAFATYRLHGCQDRLRARLISAENAALDAEQRMGWLTAAAALAPQSSGLLLQAVTLVASVALVMRGELSLGAVVGIQTLTGLLSAPVAALAGALTSLQQSAGAILRVGDLVEHPVEPSLAAFRARRVPDRIAGRLELCGVGADIADNRSLFGDVELSLAAGELVAITGRSGSGKSTLARLAAGLTSPARGRVRLDGVDLADWPPELLRRTLQYVPQTPAIFTGTIEHNLTLGDPAILPGALGAVLAQVGLDRTIAAAPAGLDTPISPSQPRLSGGELQRLMVARALLRRPLVLVLDEITSALDPLSEGNVIAGLRMSGAAVMLVTHRAGTASRCDRVYRLAGGGLRREELPAAVAAHPAVTEMIAA